MSKTRKLHTLPDRNNVVNLRKEMSDSEPTVVETDVMTFHVRIHLDGNAWAQVTFNGPKADLPELLMNQVFEGLVGDARGIVRQKINPPPTDDCPAEVWLDDVMVKGALSVQYLAWPFAVEETK